LNSLQKPTPKKKPRAENPKKQRGGGNGPDFFF